jgi:hypothetical protein
MINTGSAPTILAQIPRKIAHCKKDSKMRFKGEFTILGLKESLGLVW